jgi:hypothetical protein
VKSILQEKWFRKFTLRSRREAAKQALRDIERNLKVIQLLKSGVKISFNAGKS